MRGVAKTVLTIGGKRPEVYIEMYVIIIGRYVQVSKLCFLSKLKNMYEDTLCLLSVYLYFS